MELNSFYTRNMLHQYHKQLVASRTLAHHQRTLNMIHEEEPAIPPDVKRRLMINRVAREVFTNLLVTGNENSMVQEVRDALFKEFGEELFFQYPPTSLDLIILRNTDHGLEEISRMEHADVTGRAWAVTLRVVDSYVL